MLLKKGKNYIEYGPGEFVSARVMNGVIPNMLIPVRLQNLVSFRQSHPKAKGVPIYCAVFDVRRLELYPAADEDYLVLIHFITHHEE